MTGTRPLANCTVSSMMRACSLKSTVGDSPVVPTGTSPSIPPLIWCSTCSRRRFSSSRPSRNGVTIAVIAPLYMNAPLRGFAHDSLHLLHRVPQSDEHRPADDRVSDIQLHHSGDRSDGADVAVVQPVARMQPKAALARDRTGVLEALH